MPDACPIVVFRRLAAASLDSSARVASSQLPQRGDRDGEARVSRGENLVARVEGNPDLELVRR